MDWGMVLCLIGGMLMGISCDSRSLWYLLTLWGGLTIYTYGMSL